MAPSISSPSDGWMRGCQSANQVSSQAVESVVLFCTTPATSHTRKPQMTKKFATRILSTICCTPFVAFSGALEDVLTRERASLSRKRAISSCKLSSSSFSEARRIGRIGLLAGLAHLHLAFLSPFHRNEHVVTCFVAMEVAISCVGCVQSHVGSPGRSVSHPRFYGLLEPLVPFDPRLNPNTFPFNRKTTMGRPGSLDGSFFSGERRNSTVQSSKDDGPERTSRYRALDGSHKCNLACFTCMSDSMDDSLHSCQ